LSDFLLGYQKTIEGFFPMLRSCFGLMPSARSLAILEAEEIAMTTQEFRTPDLHETEKQALNKRLETIGWALFLIMIGGLGLIPHELVPSGIWSIGVGLIMLGLNAARYLNGIKMSGFTLVLGTIALLTGVGELLGLDLPVLPILLILIGASILLKPLFEKNNF
jgi:hypothetical protein